MKNKLLNPNKKKTVLRIKGKPDNDEKKDILKTVKLLRTDGGAAHNYVAKIMMVMAEDHKVKVLIDSPVQPEWFERKESLEQFFLILPHDIFEKVNKFYIINLNYMPSYLNKLKKITFCTGFSFQLKHKIKVSFFKDKA